MNRPTMLLSALLADAGRVVGVSTAKDVLYIERRIKNEGFSFCTITLPAISDSLESGIEAGRLCPTLSASFAFSRKRRLPQFLGGFFRRVFDDAGMLLDDPCADSILAIRQISRAFKKLFMICDDRRNSAAAVRYHQIEEELKTHDDVYLKSDPILDQTSLILGRHLCQEPGDGELVCRHGPGATGDRLSPNGRLSIRHWPERSEEYFPIADHAIPNWGLHEALGNVLHLRSAVHVDCNNGLSRPLPQYPRDSTAVVPFSQTIYGERKSQDSSSQACAELERHHPGDKSEGNPGFAVRGSFRTADGSTRQGDGNYQPNRPESNSSRTGGRSFRSAQSEVSWVRHCNGNNEAGTKLGLEPPVRVVFVPKTALTPRVIAVEPAHMQFMQQSMMNFLVKKLERSPITRGRINFSDQSINQRLAREASIDRKLATIDLKDASDRVHKDLARRIFAKTALWGYLESCRSREANLPDGTTVELRKFASMGSATCFPVEAYVFFVLILSAIHVHQKQLPTKRSVYALSRRIHVYGDDIVVPVRYVDSVCDYLESYGLKVNRNKTFAKSHFRESCGADFFCGQAVKPVYFRQLLPARTARWTPTQLLAWTSSSNQLYELGYWESTQLIRTWIEQAVGRVPRVVSPRRDDNSVEYPNGVLFTSVAFNTNLRWSKNYQRLGWRVLDFKSVKIHDPVDSFAGALFKALNNIGNDVATDFMSSMRRDVLKPKHRWQSYWALKVA